MLLSSFQGPYSGVFIAWFCIIGILAGCKRKLPLSAELKSPLPPSFSATAFALRGRHAVAVGTAGKDLCVVGVGLDGTVSKSLQRLQGLRFVTEARWVEGSLYFCGVATSAEGDDDDGFLGCIGEDRSISTLTRFGGSGDDAVTGFCPMEDHILVVGRSASYGDPEGDFYVVAITDNGKTEWEKTYPQMGPDSAVATERIDNDAAIVVGSSGSLLGHQDVRIVKLDSMGVAMWDKIYSDSWSTYPNAIVIASNGDVLIAGTADSSDQRKTVAMRIDQNGKLIWRKKYTINRYSSGIGVIRYHGGYLVAVVYGAADVGPVSVGLLSINGEGCATRRWHYEGIDDHFLGLDVTGDGSLLLAGTSRKNELVLLEPVLP